MARSSRFSPEVRDRAIRMVFEHESEYGSRWETMKSIASKIGCSAETLRKWVRQTQVDTGHRDGLTSDERARIKALERENRELSRVGDDQSVHGIVGFCPAMQSVFKTLRRVAGSDAGVLIGGESGTGKELAARAVHRLSPR